jgi:hypothetical protein
MQCNSVCPLCVNSGNRHRVGEQASGVTRIAPYWGHEQNSPQIEAHYPGAEIRYITGLTDKADIDDWMGGSRKIAWLRSQGYANDEL